MFTRIFPCYISVLIEYLLFYDNILITTNLSKGVIFLHYSIAEQNFFPGWCIDVYRNVLYQLPSNLQLIWTETFAKFLKTTQPVIHKKRSETAIAIHLIYIDNLLHGVQPRFANKDSRFIGTKPRNAGQPSGLNPLTTQFKHFLL